MKCIIKIISIIIIILSTIFLIYTIYTGYDKFLTSIITMCSGINTTERIVNIFTPKLFLILQITSFIFIILNIFIVMKVNAIYEFIRTFIIDFFIAFKNIINDIKCKEALIITIPTLFLIYLGATWYIHIDEAYTYLGFVYKYPFYTAFTKYPAPNNHVLNTLLINLTDILPISNLLLKVRIPALFASILSFIIAFSFVKRTKYAKVAMVVTTIYATAYFCIIYGFMARGYAFVHLFFIICSFATYNIITKNNRRKDWLFFIISSILGFITMPSFLYPFLSLNLVIYFLNYKNLKYQIVYGIITAIIVLILYTPIFIVEGVGAVINNEYVRPIGRLTVIEELPSFLSHSLSIIMGYPWYITLFVVILSIVFSIKAKNKKILFLWGIFILFPIIITILHSVLPFARVYSYYTFVFAFLIGMSFSINIEKLSLKVIIPFLLVLQVGSIINSVHISNNYVDMKLYIDSDDIFNKFINKNQKKTCYFITNIGLSSFQFNLLQNNINPHDNNILKRPQTEGYNVEYNADFIFVSSDYIIINTVIDSTQTKQPIYSNESWNVYLNKH